MHADNSLVHRTFGMYVLPIMISVWAWQITSTRHNRRIAAHRIVGTAKPVFGAEYCDATAAGNGVTQDPGCYCPEALQAGRNVLIKTTDLNNKVRVPRMLLWCEGSYHGIGDYSAVCTLCDIPL